MASKNKKWSDLSPNGKAAVVAALGVHVCLVGVAHADLTRRRADEVRGPKFLWRLLTAANTSFIAAYYLWGRDVTAAEQVDS